MTTIRTTCSDDGEVDLTPADVTIADDESYYSFICPKCGVMRDKRADGHIISLLRGAGVGEYPPITNRDILVFSSNIDEEIEKLLG